MAALSDSTVTIYEQFKVDPNYISDKLPLESQLDQYKKICQVLQKQLLELEAKAHKHTVEHASLPAGLTEKELNTLVDNVMQMIANEISHSPDLKKQLGFDPKHDQKVTIGDLKDKLYTLLNKEKKPTDFEKDDLTKSCIWVMPYTPEIKPAIDDLERLESLKAHDVDLKALHVFKDVIEILVDPVKAQTTTWGTRITTIIKYSLKGASFANEHYYLIPLLMPLLAKSGLYLKVMRFLVAIIARRLLHIPVKP